MSPPPKVHRKPRRLSLLSSRLRFLTFGALFWLLCGSTLGAAWLAMNLSMPTASAVVYGGGTFSQCEYSRDCPQSSTNTTSSPTVVSPAPATPESAPSTTDSPKIIIVTNIQDGQVIHTTSTEIVVAHLERVDTSGNTQLIPISDIGWLAFYVDDKLVTTVYHVSDDGQFHITWDVAKYKGTRLALVFYDKAGKLLQRLDKTVSLAASLASGEITIATSPGGQKHKLLLTPREEAFVRSLPYWLLLILLLVALRMWVQSVRDIRAAHRLAALLQREQDIYEQKQNFLALIGHYLRTPLTTLRGGLELMASEPQHGDLTAINRTVDALALRIKEAVAAAENQTASVVPSVGRAAVELRSPLRAPSFWLLVASFLLVSLLFELLARYFTTLSYSWYETFLRLFVGLAVVVFLLLGMRQSRSKRAERQLGEQALEAQYGLDSQRTAFIGSVAGGLSADVQAVTATTTPILGAGQSSGFIRKALADFGSVAQQFRIAASLTRDTFAPANLSTVRLNDAVDQALRARQTALEAKHLTITPLAGQFVVRNNPAIVDFIIGAVIDNAVNFNNQDGSISLAATESSAVTSLQITDTGAGIAPEALSRLMQPFSREASALDFTHEGMGFDLYLCRLLLMRMHGDIALDGSTGSGTTVRLELPQIL